MSANDNATRRSEARERRRAARRGDDHDDGANGSGAGGNLEEAARAAAAAAAVGAALGAVKALASRDREDDEHAQPATAERPTDEDEADVDATAGDETVDGNEDGRRHHQLSQAAATEQDPWEEERQERQERPEQREAKPGRPREGASSGTVRSIAARAREQLHELQGRDAESITALERTGDGWRVTCEIVEVERIPKSTDVLATYVIELDGDGELIAFERVRRYYRAQADRGGEP